MNIGESMSEDISEKEKFKFEREGLDFPFYNNKPHLSNSKWIILAIGFIITVLFSLIPKLVIPQDISGFLYFLIPFLTFFYVANGKLGLIIKKFQKSDVWLMLGTLILYFVYTTIIVLLLSSIGIVSTANPAIHNLDRILFWIVFPFQIFGEELIKLIPFLIVLFLVYKFTNNRKIGLIIAALASVLIFGLMHYNTYGNIITVILIQGMGSIIMLFAYLKSKNILTSYIVHLATDTLLFISAVVGKAFLPFLFL